MNNVDKNILVATLGNWRIIPELIGFTNPDDLPLYEFHPQKKWLDKSRDTYHIPPVQALWILSTDRKDDIPDLKQWHKRLVPSFELKIFILHGIGDLEKIRDVRTMTDLIYRVTFYARKRVGKGRVYLSLAGGRKTMSADIQRAAQIFGCEAILHVIDKGKSTQNIPNEFEYLSPLPKAVADAFLPIVVSGAIDVNPAISLLKAPSWFFKEDGIVQPQTPAENFWQEVERQLKKPGNLWINYRKRMYGDELRRGNFRALYMLPPRYIKKLHEWRIGVDKKQKKEELDILKRLPKAELHCHFGGILSAAEMIEVARANDTAVIKYGKLNYTFGQWLKRIEKMIQMDDLSGLKRDVPDVIEIRTKFTDLPRPLAVAGFLSLFKNHVPLLEKFIYGDYLLPDHFYKTGIEKYEKLGDLQGSALMQSEESIRAACKILVKKCKAENIRYLELRQSPVKYTRGSLSPEQVTTIIRDELSLVPDTTFRTIFIASRHGKMSEIYQHIELADRLFKNDPTYENWLVGFDLAGAEKERKPSELREAFMPMMEKSLNITIHAGENEDVRNIWEAVYHLNADRIGHGLTLRNDLKLKNRFLNRAIAIEMCPSSNDQIVGFPKKDYPLYGYLKDGLNVTVNTDNPGISRTGFSNEYYKAACMSPNGLSLWEVLQLVRNSFRAAFLPYEKRRALLLNAEQEIMDMLNNIWIY